MSNPCTNTFLVTGPVGEIQRFKAFFFVANPYNPHNIEPNFNGVIPMPVAVEKNLLEQHEWIKDNWGCHFTSSITISSETENALVFAFETANVPPVAIFEALGQQFTSLAFNIRSEECGFDLLVDYVAENGSFQTFDYDEEDARAYFLSQSQVA